MYWCVRAQMRLGLLIFVCVATVASTDLVATNSRQDPCPVGPPLAADHLSTALIMDNRWHIFDTRQQWFNRFWIGRYVDSAWWYGTSRHKTRLVSWEGDGKICAMVFPSGPIGNITRVVGWFNERQRTFPVVCDGTIGYPSGPVTICFRDIGCRPGQHRESREACDLPSLPVQMNLIDRSISTIQCY